MIVIAWTIDEHSHNHYTITGVILVPLEYYYNFCLYFVYDLIYFFIHFHFSFINFYFYFYFIKKKKKKKGKNKSLNLAII